MPRASPAPPSRACFTFTFPTISFSRKLSSSEAGSITNTGAGCCAGGIGATSTVGTAGTGAGGAVGGGGADGATTDGAIVGVENFLTAVERIVKEGVDAGRHTLSMVSNSSPAGQLLVAASPVADDDSGPL